MAKRALNTLFYIGANPVGSVNSIGGVDVKANVIDVSLLSDDYKKVLGGQKSVSDVTIAGFFDGTDTNGQVALYGLLDTGVSTAMSIIFPAATGASWTFNAVVTGFKTGGTKPDGTVDFECSIAIDGKPTLNLSLSTGLTALAVLTGALTPTFLTTRYEYNVTATASPYTVTPTAAGPNITVNGQGVTSGSASGNITLTSTGITPIYIQVSQAGKTPVTYTLNVYLA